MLTRHCIQSHHNIWLSRKYMKELEAVLELQQQLNTMQKIDMMAMVSRDRVPDEDTTPEEIEEDVVRMEKIRDKRREVLANQGIVESILRNMDYYPSHMELQRGAFNALQQLVRCPVAMERFLNRGYADEIDYDRRKAGVPSSEVRYERVVRTRGLSGWKNKASNTLASKSSDEGEESQAKSNKYNEECDAALQHCLEQELTPRMPLRMCRILAYFHDDEILHEYAEDISDSIRGVYEPLQRIERIILQAKTLLESRTRSQHRIESVDASHGEFESGRSAWSTPSRSKYAATQTQPQYQKRNHKGKRKKKKRGKKRPFPFVKGDRVECKCEEWWRQKYRGTVVKARRAGERGFNFDVDFDFGKRIEKIPTKQISSPCLPELDPEEALRSLLRIASFPRWQIRPYLQMRAIYAMKLVLDCGDKSATPRLFVMLDGVSTVLAAMQLYPNNARLNIRSAQLMASVIFGPPLLDEEGMHIEPSLQKVLASREKFALAKLEEEERAIENQKKLQSPESDFDTILLGSEPHSEAAAKDGEQKENEKQEAQRKRSTSTANTAKAFASAGAVKLICKALRCDFHDAGLNRTMRKVGIWALHALAQVRANINILESEGAMYCIQMCMQDPCIVIPQHLKKVDWKSLRERRLAGGIDDELEKIKFLKELFVPCVHTATGSKCTDPRHCMQCFVNKHSSGFWHKIGCREHPGNTNVATLLEMQQLRKNVENRNAKREAELQRNEGFNQANSYAGKYAVSGLNEGEFFAEDRNSKHIGRAIPEEWLHD